MSGLQNPSDRGSALNHRDLLIVTCNNWGYDEIGGGYKIATEFAVDCAENGLDVHYVCSHVDPSKRAAAAERGVTVWRYPRPANIGGAGKFILHLTRTAAVVRNILRRVPSGRAVILNGHSPLQYLGALRSRPRQTLLRRVYSVHSPLAAEYAARDERSPANPVRAPVLWALRRVEADCYKRSDVIQCDSRFTQSLLERDFSKETKGRLLVCPGYVDLEKFRVRHLDRIEARRRTGHEAWSGRGVFFFSLRRHVARMGLDRLIRACAWIREKLSGSRAEFKMVVAGDGPLRTELQALSSTLKLNDVVRFTGTVPETDIAVWYRAADCFVLPTSSLECFGLVILESFAAGTPVIATPVGAIPEVLGPFSRECLTEGTSVEQIGAAMLGFLTRGHSEVDEADLVEHARRYDKRIVMKRLTDIVLGRTREA